MKQSICAPFVWLVASLAVAPMVRANDIDVAQGMNPPRQHEKPTLILKINKEVSGIDVQLKSSAGGSLRKRSGAGAVGTVLTIELDHTRAGTVQWKGELSVEFADGNKGSMPLAFSTTVVAPFRFQVKSEDLAHNSITVVSERATQKIDVEIYGEYDALLASQSFDQAGAKAGTPMTVTWDPKNDGLILRAHIDVTDTNTAVQGTDLFPYNIAIPHDDVEFEFGKADVRVSEEPKMQAALGEVKKAVERYGTAVKVQGVQIRLFVGGHTDTVGSPSANMALSQRRALAIAKWFADHNIEVGVYARGFGESVLKVQTPDETDNQSNRRVDYDVGTDGPTRSLTGWTRVK